MQYCFYLDWKGLTPSEWAAWVQAVGSILAIAVAIFLPWRARVISDREEERLRKTRERTTALTTLRRIRHFLTWVDGQLRDFRTGGMRWCDVNDPLTSIIEDPPADPVALGDSAEAYQTFVARCDDAMTTIGAFAAPRPAGAIEDDPQAVKALAKVDSAIRAAQMLQQHLQRMIGIETEAEGRPAA